MISNNYDFSLDCMHAMYACVLCMYTVHTAHARPHVKNAREPTTTPKYLSKNHTMGGEPRRRRGLCGFGRDILEWLWASAHVVRVGARVLCALYTYIACMHAYIACMHRIHASRASHACAHAYYACIISMHA